MKGADQSRQLFFRDILQLVDDQDDRGALLLGSFADRDNQIGKICFEIAAICEAGFDIEVQTHLEIVIFHLELRETGQGAKCTLYAFRRLLHAIEPEQRSAQRRYENAGKRPILRCLDSDDGHALPFSGVPHRRQQHGLADAAKAIENAGARCPAHPDSVESDRIAFEQRISAGQFRRASASARSERVASGVHSEVMSVYHFSVNLLISLDTTSLVPSLTSPA